MARTKKTPRKQSHKCNVCGQCFGTKRASKYHMLTEHLGEVGCTVCLKSFSKKFYYEKHMKKLHAGEEKDLKIEKDTEETVKEQIEVKDLKIEKDTEETVEEQIEEQGESSRFEDNEKDTSSDGEEESESESSCREKVSDWEDIEEVEIAEAGINSEENEPVQLVIEEKISKNEEEDQTAEAEKVSKKGKVQSVVEEKTSKNKGEIQIIKPGVSDSNNNIFAQVDNSNAIIQKEVVQEEGDKRMVREVFAGRTVSKPTRPNPVYTPRRKKAEASTMTHQQKDSESEIESDIDEVTVVMKAGGKTNQT